MATAQNVKLRVIELRAEGVSFARIAAELNIAKQTAVDIAKDNIDGINTLQAIGEEALFEERKVNAIGRIEQLSALHSRLREEIERRDLSEVPTDKLVSLFLKTSDALKSEVFTPHIESTEEQEATRSHRHLW